jgi:hypothetical protein
VIARLSRYRVDDPEERLEIDAAWDGFRGREFYDLQPIDDPTLRTVIEVFRDRASAEAAPRIPFKGTLESEELCFFFGGVAWHSPALNAEHQRLLQQLVPVLAERLQPHLPIGWMSGRFRGYVRGHIESSFSYFEELGSTDLVGDVANAIANLLHNMSGEIEDDLGIQWPNESAGYRVEPRGRSIEAWFGDRDRPVLTIEPIALDEIGL